MCVHPVCFFLVAICVLLCSTVSAKESTDNLEERNQQVGEEFVPEKDWKVIKEGQSIPAGLYIRMDLTTGLREAKLLDSSKSDSQQPSEIQLVPSAVAEDDEYIQQRHAMLRSEMEKALKNLMDSSHADFKAGEEDSSYNATEVRAKYHSYGELKKDFAALNKEIKTDQESIKGLMSRYRNCRNDETKEIKQINLERLTILQVCGSLYASINNKNVKMVEDGWSYRDVRQAWAERPSGFRLVGAASLNGVSANRKFFLKDLEHYVHQVDNALDLSQ